MNTSEEFPSIYMNFIERFLASFPVMTSEKNEKLQTAKIIIKLYISEKLVKK